MFLVLVSLSLRKFKGFSSESFSSRDWLLIVLSALSGALSCVFYFLLKFGFASKVVAIDRLSLVFVIILAVLFLVSNRVENSFGDFLMVAGAILISL